MTSSLERKCSYPPCGREAVTTFLAEWGIGYLCAEHAERTNVVEQRLATMNRDETYAYFDGLIDAQQGMTTTEKDALREHLRAKYADRD